MPCFVLEMFAGLKMFRDIAKDVFTQIAKGAVGQGSDHGFSYTMNVSYNVTYSTSAESVAGRLPARM
ncbi:hypothetical protein F2Q68_00031825 [Brassica cretica]|uniref:Uncharacterized protein n=1 Tax=Brassica cretica TaxID=69181 RepID=A0A8S9GJI6_BRACR|nr:hypothetical protein F2Q68_00031825 [Brassica cretica]